MFQITLKSARVNAGLTLENAAQLFNIHRTTLSNYEMDCTDVPRLFLLKIEEVYNISIDRIYFGKQSEYFKMQKEQCLKQA